MTKYCLLKCSACFLIQPRTINLHRMAPHITDSVCQYQSLIQENVLIEMLTGQSNGGDSPVEVPSSKVTLVCVKLTKPTELS